jgi:hypothetical protein
VAQVTPLRLWHRVICSVDDPDVQFASEDISHT